MKIFSPLIAAVFIMLFQQKMYAQKVEQAKVPGNYTIENCVNEFDLAQAKKTNSGYQYWFADKKFTEENTLKMSIVEPGKSTHAPHRHPEEEFFYILEGKASFYLNGKTVEVGPNTSLYCPPNSEHGISNAGDKDLKYLVIKKDLR
ncbi:cupin domain-containing protein [Chryseobacterium sp. Leaf394]|uniref:cupin domain-containing protein n=1 Tax=Chryseobacterium sp. Leaf394 TaxID=1736361 RepID=UPI0006F5C0F3|nr:cupin domain-containing protein [Chryseobacterium sp. Leaf394]KQS94001.1 cupin [Chryseobacterium sp. Leaf394]